MNFENKIVFVSGANRGIGKALIENLLQRGVQKVYAAARNADKLPDFNDKRIVPITLDITNADHIKNAVDTASDTQILINNAGVASFGSAFDAPFEDIEKDMKVNYYGTLSMMRAFIPALQTKEAATLVNVTTIGNFVNFPFLGGYCASKAALYSVTQGARMELASKGISVHSVNPGPIDTDMAKDLGMDKTNASTAAAAILDGIQAGEADIFPDPAGKQMFEVWQKDYRELEAMVAGM